MRVERLIFKGLGGYQREVELDFSSLKLVLLEGVNGAGKSSILDSLTWVLFDRTVRGVQKGDWLNNCVKSGWGKVILRDKDVCYEILRERDRSGIKLSFKENGNEIQIRSTQELQKLIEEKIGTYDLFVNSVMFGQGDLLDLAFATDKRKKELIGELLGFDEIDTVYKKVREQLRTQTTALTMLQDRIDEYEQSFKDMASVTEQDLEECKSAIVVIKKRMEKTQSLEEDLDSQLKKVIEYESLLSEKRYIENQLSEEQSLRDSLAKLNEISSSRQSLQDQKAELENVKADIDDLILKLKLTESAKLQEETMLKKQVKKVSEIDSRCPTCLQTLSETKKQEILKGLQEKIDNIVIEQKKIRDSIGEQQKKQSNLVEQITMFEERLKELDEQLSKRAVIEQKLQSIENLKDRLTELKKREEQLVVGKTRGEIESQLQEVRDKKRELHNRLMQLEEEKAQIESRLSIKKDVSERLEEAKKKYTEAQKLSEHLKFLENLLGLKGIRNKILETVIPFLEKEVNAYLTLLLPSVGVSFTTQKQGKSTILNEFTMNLYDYSTQETRDFRLWSGGEKMLISLALRFALWKTSHLFGRRSLDILFLDEIFGCLDDSYREKVLLFLEQQQRELDIPVIVVEHIPDVRDRFNQVISVYKDAEGGYIERK